MVCRGWRGWESFVHRVCMWVCGGGCRMMGSLGLTCKDEESPVLWDLVTISAFATPQRGEIQFLCP